MYSAGPGSHQDRYVYSAGPGILPPPGIPGRTGVHRGRPPGTRGEHRGIPVAAPGYVAIISHLLTSFGCIRIFHMGGYDAAHQWPWQANRVEAPTTPEYSLH